MKNKLLVLITLLLTCTGVNNTNIKVTVNPHITALSTMSALPLSPLIITGTNFSTTEAVAVRFSDSSGYQVDVPVLAPTSTSARVYVPPFIASGNFDSGTVSAQIIEVSGNDTTKSNSINFFQIENPPVSLHPPSTVTLNFLTAELVYYDSIQARMKGTALESPSTDSTIAKNIANLSALVSQVQSVVQGSAASFSLGSINGIALSVGPNDLVKTDRLILCMLGNSSNTALAKKLAADCMDYLSNDAIGGANANQSYQLWQDCNAIQPVNAVNQGFTFLLGIGSAAVGILALAGAPAIALALPGAALLYLGVMDAGIQLDVGALLKDVNQVASYQALKNGIEQTEKLLTDPIKGAIINHVFNETVGQLKDVYDGAKDAITSFVPPVAAPCTYRLSSLSQSFDSSGGSGSVSVTAPQGCTWTAEVDNVDWVTVTAGGVSSGSGSVTFAVKPNTTPDQRSADIFIADKAFSITQTGSHTSVTVPPGFPANVPAGIYTVAVTSNAGGSYSFTDTCSDISAFSQALLGTMNTTISQLLAACQGAGCNCTASPVTYTPWNGTSFTVNGSVVGLSAGNCLGATAIITFTVTKN